MSVDNRIVNMEFNNKGFMNGVKDTIGALSKLGEKLKLSESAKGFSTITDSANKVDLSGIGKSVDNLNQKFSVMDIVGVTALVNIANSAINAGKKFAKSLTIDPITDGLKEYETKMGAIQTIMTNTASKGTTLEQINDALGELNEYSDQTIYNFAQMTDNIGKATAAGVGLKDSVTFVKGMSNVAAGFGVDASRMAGATQQMTQALASGTLRLQDWISMESAGMGGEMIQQALVGTAKEMGVYVDESIPFRKTLESNWLSSEIFIATMAKMAEDKTLLAAATEVTTFTKLIGNMKEVVGSGWAVSWENILGNKSQSTKLFTDISKSFSNLVGEMSNYRNAALKTWNEDGGRDAALAGLSNILSAISKILGPIYEAYIKIIDPWNGERLVAMSKGFENLTKKLVINDKTMGYISTTFEGVFNLFKLAGLILKPITGLFGGLNTEGKGVVETFFELTSKVGAWITKTTEAVEKSGALQSAMSVMEKVGGAVSFILDKVLTSGGDLLVKALDTIIVYADSFINIVGETLTKAGEFARGMVNFVSEMVEGFSPLEVIVGVVVNGFKAIQDGLQSFLDFAATVGKSIGSFFGNIMGELGSSGVLGTDIVSVGLFAGIYSLAKNLLPSLEKIGDGIGGFKDGFLDLLDGLGGVLENYQKNIQADTIQKIAVAIGILAVSLFILSAIEPTKATSAALTLGALMGGLILVLKAFEKIEPMSVFKSISAATLLVGFSVAVGILGLSLLVMSRLSWDEIGRGLAAMAGVAVLLVAVSKTLENVEIGPGTALGLMGLAGSIYILGQAMSLMGKLDSNTIIKGLGAMGITMIALSGFLNSTKNVKNNTAVAASLIPLSLSLLIFAGVIAIFGSMETSKLVQGFLALSMVLGVLGVFGQAMSGSNKGLIQTSVAMLILSVAMVALSGAIAILGNMEMSTLIKGIGAMAVSMLLFAGITKIVSPVALMLLSVAMAAMGVAMILLGVGLGVLGSLSLGTIATGLLTVIGVLVVFAGLSMALSTAVPAMIAMAIGLGALGIAAGLTGVGLLALGIGITAIVAAIVGAGAGITTVIVTLVNAIPLIANAIALGIISLIVTLGAGGAQLTVALTQIIQMLLNVVNNNIPLFVETLVTLITEAIKAIVELTPVVVDAIMSILTAILTGLSENLPTIVTLILTTLTDTIVAVLEGLANAIGPIAKGIVDIIVAIIGAIGDGVPRIVDAAFDLIISLINGLTDTVKTKMPEVRSAIKGLITAIKDEFINSITDFKSIGSDIMAGLKNGITSGVVSVGKAIGKVATGLVNGARDFLGINSPSKVFAEIGEFINAGLSVGLNRTASIVEKDAIAVADKTVGGMKKALSGIDTLLGSDMSNQPVIRPVVDLSNVETAGSEVNGLFASGKIGVGATLTASRIGVINQNNSQNDLLKAINDLKSNIGNSSSSNFTINGLTYDDGSAVSDAVKTLVRAARIERRV